MVTEGPFKKVKFLDPSPVEKGRLILTITRGDVSKI